MKRLAPSERRGVVVLAVAVVLTALSAFILRQRSPRTEVEAVVKERVLYQEAKAGTDSIAGGEDRTGRRTVNRKKRGEGKTKGGRRKKSKTAGKEAGKEAVRNILDEPIKGGN